MSSKHIVRYSFTLDQVKGEIEYDPSTPGSYMDAITEISALKQKITEAGVHVLKESIAPVRVKDGGGQHP